MPFMFAFLAWLWSIGWFCSSLVRPAGQLNLRFFRFAIIYPGLFILAFYAVFSIIGPWVLVVIFPLHLFAMFCFLYDLYYVSKALALVTTGRANFFYQYAGPFFLLWFFPIGVWIVQPRINKLYQQGATYRPVSSPATAPSVSVPAFPPGVPTYAGFWWRCGAALIDAAVLFFPLSFTMILSYHICEAVLDAKRYNPDWALLTWPVVFVISTLCYFAFLESSQWQATLGKKVLGVCVSDIEKRRLTLGRAAGRTFAKYVSCLTVGVGFVICGFTKKKQALHDLIARCLVLRPLAVIEPKS